MGMWAGISKGLAAVEETKFAEDKMDMMRRQEERLEEQFKLDKRAQVFANLKSITSGFGPNKNGSSKNSTSTSIEGDVERTNTLTAIEDMLPENSPLAAKLVNAPLSNLQEVTTIIAAARAKSQSIGMPFTSDSAEDLFQNYYETVVVQKSPFDVDGLAEQLNVDLGEDSGFGGTWEEILSDYTKDSTFRSGLMVQNTPVEPFSPQEINAFTSQYNSVLRSNLLELNDGVQIQILEEAKKLEADPNFIRDESLLQRATAIDSALKAMKGENPTSYLAIKIVGPEVGAQMIRMDSRLSGDKYRGLLNKGLTFTGDSIGDQRLSMAVKSGLLNVGDSYFHRGSQILSEETYQTIMGN